MAEHYSGLATAGNATTLKARNGSGHTTVRSMTMANKPQGTWYVSFETPATSKRSFVPKETDKKLL